MIFYFYPKLVTTLTDFDENFSMCIANINVQNILFKYTLQAQIKKVVKSDL